MFFATAQIFLIFLLSGSYRLCPNFKSLKAQNQLFLYLKN